MTPPVTLTDPQTQVVIAEEGEADIVVVPEVETVVVTEGIEGQQGPPGDQGPIGPQGPQGVPGAGTFYYLHDQMVPANPWVIVHNLGNKPNVTVVDSTDREVVGDVVHDSINQLTVTFSSAFAGKAYMS